LPTDLKHLADGYYKVMTFRRAGRRQPLESRKRWSVISFLPDGCSVKVKVLGQSVFCACPRAEQDF
jgi:hypothetical protein